MRRMARRPSRGVQHQDNMFQSQSAAPSASRGIAKSVQHQDEREMFAEFAAPQAPQFDMFQSLPGAAPASGLSFEQPQAKEIGLMLSQPIRAELMDCLDVSDDEAELDCFIQKESAPGSFQAPEKFELKKQPKRSKESSKRPQGLRGNTPEKKTISVPGVTLDWLIRQQKFSGNFSFGIDTVKFGGFKNGIAKLKSAGVNDQEVIATLIAILLLHTQFEKKKEEWALLEAKAKQWVSGKMSMKLDEALALLH